MPLMADTGSAAKKRCSVPGAHDGQPKRLIPLACDFCDRLVAAHANGAGHSQPCHAVAYTPRNQQRVFGRKATRCDIDKGFVDGYALDARGLVGENRHDLRAHLAVAIKVPVRPNGFRHKRRASAEAMAECTPKRRASYEHVDTTPRESASPPTMSGLPRHSG